MSTRRLSFGQFWPLKFSLVKYRDLQFRYSVFRREDSGFPELVLLIFRIWNQLPNYDLNKLISRNLEAKMGDEYIIMTQRHAS